MTPNWWLAPEAETKAFVALNLRISSRPSGAFEHQRVFVKDAACKQGRAVFPAHGLRHDVERIAEHRVGEGFRQVFGEVFGGRSAIDDERVLGLDEGCGKLTDASSSFGSFAPAAMSE